jgi:hypothetical protein
VILDWLMDLPGRFTRPTPPSPAQEIDESQIVSMARELYLGAFERALGRASEATLAATTIDGDPVWRLTLVVPAALLEHANQLVELESVVHRDVLRRSPAYAGFFSLQYIPVEGDA